MAHQSLAYQSLAHQSLAHQGLPLPPSGPGPTARAAGRLVYFVR